MSLGRGSFFGKKQKGSASGEINTAIDECVALLRTRPRDWRVMVRVADLFLQAHDSSQAVRYLKMAADVCLAEGLVSKAQALYIRIGKLDPGQMAVREKLAELNLRQGGVQEAQDEFLAVIDHYVGRKNGQQAISAYRRLIQTDPTNLDWHWELAGLCEQEMMSGSAVAAYLEIARIALRLPKLQSAAAACERAYALSPRNPLVLWRFLEVRLASQQEDQAAKLLGEFLSVDTDHFEIHIEVNKALSDHRRLEQIVKLTDRLIQEGGEKSSVIKFRTELLLKNGDVPAAFLEFSRLIDENRGLPNGRKSNHLLEQMVASDPSFYPALEHLAQVYESTGNDKAVSTRASLADAYMTNRLYDKAAAVLTDLIGRDPDHKARYADKLRLIHALSPGISEPEGDESPIELEIEVEEPEDSAVSEPVPADQVPKTA